MANQWGRENSVRTGTGSRGSVVLPVILSLVLGIGGTYGYMRFAGADPSARQQAEIAALQDRIADDDARLSALEAENGRLRTAAAEGAISGNREANPASRAEMAALQRQSEERAARISALSEELRQLKAKNAGLEDAAATQTAEISRLTDLNRTAQTQNSARADAEISRLRADILEAETRHKAALQQLRVANDRDLSALRDEISRKTGELAAARAVVETLNARVQTLEAALRDQAAKPADPAPQSNLDDLAPPQGQEARSALMVEEALNRTPGLGNLSDAERTRLKESLVSGACVTEALERIFDRVPVIVLRNLIRDLKSTC